MRRHGRRNSGETRDLDASRRPVLSLSGVSLV